MKPNGFWRLTKTVFLGGLTLVAGRGWAAEAAKVWTCGVPAPVASALGLAPAPGGFFQAPTNWTTGRKRFLFIRVRMTDELEDPVDDAEAEATLRQVDQTFQRISYGAFSLDWRITPVLRLPHSVAYYDTEGRDRLQADARAAAKAAGFDFEAYDLDVVRHNPIPSYAGGYGNLGARGAWVGADGAYVILHEVGHNLGLHHANFWDTSGPSSSPKVSPPFPSNVDEGREGHEFDPDSLVGHDTVAGPGRSMEYGDLFDIMGLGGEYDQFNAAYLHFLGWLPATHLLPVTTNGVYRLHAFSAPDLIAGQAHVARLARPTLAAGMEQYYWLQFNPATNNLSLRNGVQLHWLGEVSGAPSTLLLDATSGTGQAQLDCALLIGHTFTDFLADIHVTPLDQGETAGTRWIDVAIQLGPFPANLPPSLDVAADRVQVAPGEVVRFTATASDPNGDRLAYAWDLGDHSPTANTNVVSQSWEKAGEYLVRCEVSDLRGGRASRNILITVGAPETWHIRGRVVDENGQPVAGVRVHNGHTSRNPIASGYVWTRSDSAGLYTLANLKPDSYPVGAFVPGHHTVRAGAYVPITVSDQHVTGVDFVARRIPAITVRMDPPVVKEGDAAASVVFTRAGALDLPLTIGFTLGGTAQARSDYVGLFVNRATFPAGHAEARISLATIADQTPEPAETVILSLVAASESRRQTVVDGRPVEYTVYYPGWELRALGNEEVWAQTSPEFKLTAQTTATLTILDGGTPDAVLGFVRPGKGDAWLTLEGPPGTYVIQTSTDLAGWAPLSTNVLGPTRLEIPIALPPNHSRVFYRAMRQ